LHIADVTMFHAPASGGVRTYLQAKHRVFSHLPQLRTSLLVPGAERDSLGDHHTLPALHLPLGQGYRFPLRGSPWRDALVDLKPDLIEAGDPYVTLGRHSRQVNGSVCQWSVSITPTSHV